jgi:endonuclease/exonuclease/phosphatase family metal-dependent hydrolase
MTALTVMTFNIKGSYYEDGVNNWPHRAGLNARLITAENPDLIGFQELQQGNLDTYAEHLPGYQYALGAETARENNSGHPYHCAIYWRESRFDLVKQGHFFLNETPEVYALHWGVTQGRTVNWVQLHDRLSGRHLLHVNTHLPHDSEPGRLNSARLIVNRLPALQHDVSTVIMTADFNARAHPLEPMWLARLPVEQRSAVEHQPGWSNTNEVYRIFMDAGFHDAFIEAGHQDEPALNTFHGMMGQGFPQIGFRIDWILFKDNTDHITTQSARIITDAQPPIYPSDHYPVVAQLEL